MSRVRVVLTVLVIIAISSSIAREKQLQFVSVVFRHGDRAPDDNGKELYPNDPYLQYNFYPTGLGGLTNRGKMREYFLGTMLRRRYGAFLGDIYLHGDIDARSSEYARTKTSLSLVLASLYPPAQIQRWNSQLNWQPIPTSYVPEKFDHLLVPEQCPQYLEEIERVLNLPEVEDQYEEFRPLMDKLTNYTGKPIDTFNDIYYLYHDLMAEYSMGLELPKWTKYMFPYGRLYEATLYEYEIMSYNDQLKRLNGGILLRRMVDDMLATTKNGTKNARKMNVFAGHETNVAALLQTLGVFEPHVPQYSSGVFVELTLRDGRYYVEVLHYLGIPPAVEPVKIPGCDQLCPLDDFIRLLKNVIPDDKNLNCTKSIAIPEHS